MAHERTAVDMLPMLSRQQRWQHSHGLVSFTLLVVVAAVAANVFASDVLQRDTDMVSLILALASS